jgi:hypothetical protein
VGPVSPWPLSTLTTIPQTPMPEPPPETLAWLRHAASCGKADAQLTLHILERLEALEARPIPYNAAHHPDQVGQADDHRFRGPDGEQFQKGDGDA